MLQKNIIPGSGAAASGSGVGFFGRLSLPYMFAHYLAGSAFNPTGGAILLDQTGGGRHAVKIGAPVQAALYGDGLTNDNCWEAPITGDSMDDVYAGMTLLAVAQAAPGVTTALIGNYGPDSNALSATLAMPSGYLVRTYATLPLAQSQIAADALRGSRWTFAAGVIGRTASQVFERHAGAALQVGAATTYADRETGGPAKLRIGGGQSSTTFNGSNKLVWAGIAPPLTQAQISEIADRVNEFLTPFALGV